MKKLVSILLTAGMLLSSVALATGCSGKLVKKNKDSDDDDDGVGFMSNVIGSSDDMTDPEPDKTTTDSEPDPTSEPPVTTEPSDLSKNLDNDVCPLVGPSYNVGSLDFDSQSFITDTLTEQVIWSQDGLSISVLRFYRASSYEKCVSLRIDNQSDSAVHLHCDYIYIDGFEEFAPLIEDVAAGESVETGCYFIDSMGKDVNDWNPEQFDFEFEVEFDNGYSYVTPRIAVFTSLFDGDATVDLSFATPVYDNGTFRIYAIRFYVDGGNDSVIDFVVENNSDSRMIFKSDSMYINGKETSDIVFRADVSPHSRYLLPFTMRDDKLAEMGISAVAQVAMQLVYESYDDLFNPIMFPEAFYFEIV